MKNVFLAMGLTLAVACTAPRNQVLVRTADGGAVRLQVVSPDIVRVSISPSGRFSDRQSLMVLPQEGCEAFHLEEGEDSVVLSTSSLVVKVSREDGGTAFFRADGTPLAVDGHASFAPAQADGKKAWSTTVSYASAEDEAFYGLGQHQAGEFNHKGLREELYQYNTKISVPVVVSNKGYGFLFDAYSLSRWGSARPYAQLGEVFDLQLTGTYTPAEGQPLVQPEDSLFYENEWAIRNLPDVPLLPPAPPHRFMDARIISSPIQSKYAFSPIRVLREHTSSRIWASRAAFPHRSMISCLVMSLPPDGKE